MNIFTNLNKMEHLINELKIAEKILSDYSGGYSGKYSSAEEFHSDLVNRIEKLENGDITVIDELWIWFAPTCQWDDFVGNLELGESIFQKLNDIKIKPAGNNGLAQ